MLYSNRKMLAEERVFDFGAIWQVCMGEKGRGRRLLALTCPPHTEVKASNNVDLTVGFTKSGKPRIIAESDPQVYMCLSSEAGYTRRGNGRIYVPGIPSENEWQAPALAEGYTPLANGNGADGDAGRIGDWDVVLLSVPFDGARVRVRPSGGYDPDEFYITVQGQVFALTGETIDDAAELLGIDINMPETWARV